MTFCIFTARSQDTFSVFCIVKWRTSCVCVGWATFSSIRSLEYWGIQLSQMPISWITCQNFCYICLFFFAELFFITIFSIFDESGPKTVEIFRQKLMKRYDFFNIANTKFFFGMILETPGQKKLFLIYNLFFELL